MRYDTLQYNKKAEKIAPSKANIAIFDFVNYK